MPLTASQADITYYPYYIISSKQNRGRRFGEKTTIRRDLGRRRRRTIKTNGVFQLDQQISLDSVTSVTSNIVQNTQTCRPITLAAYANSLHSYLHNLLATKDSFHSKERIQAIKSNAVKLFRMLQLPVKSTGWQGPRSACSSHYSFNRNKPDVTVLEIRNFFVARSFVIWQANMAMTKNMDHYMIWSCVIPVGSAPSMASPPPRLLYLT